MPNLLDCTSLGAALLAKEVKKYQKEPQVNGSGPISWFLEVPPGKTPADYIAGIQPYNGSNSGVPTYTLIGAGFFDLDDNKTWDCYALNCPTGPPCKEL